MPSPERLREAERVLVVCNACRYCEGFCAVFPAMERRRTFQPAELTYLANLCHNCRACYYACQFAPPHEFALNVPRTLAELREETYQDFAWPRALGGLFRRNGLVVTLIAALSVVAVVLAALAAHGPAALGALHTGEGAFYAVVSYEAMVVPFTLLGAYIVLALAVGAGRFWRAGGGTLGGFLQPALHGRALSDAARLRYLGGGGDGCNYPDERFSTVRRRFHHLTFYGFLLCFASTTVAAAYEHFLHWRAPYPLLSWPVVLGTVGGVSLLLGTAGLLWLKTRMDRAPAAGSTLGMDVAFLAMLFLTSLTGLLLLALRETSAMGTLLVVHLGFVAGLFLTMPYGKFVHGVYRYMALLQNAAEEAREAR
jgi:citrate/tricarballylate utilization protein